MKFVSLGRFLGALFLGSAAFGATLVESAPAGSQVTFVSSPIGERFVYAMGWSQTGTFAEMQVQAWLGDYGNNGDATAYLMRAIGPQATAADEIAFRTFDLASYPANEQNPETVFQGLTLGPGSYYLVIVTPTQLANQGPAGLRTGNQITTFAGSAYLGNFSRNNYVSGYAPASQFVSWSGLPYHLAFRVTGRESATAPVPEPVTTALVGGGLLALGLLRRRAR